jgi:prepilin-type N-terminal cleavage/methylation domain-containing protein
VAGRPEGLLAGSGGFSLAEVMMATLVFGIIGEREMFQRLAFLYQNFLTVAAIALIVMLAARMF